MQNCFNLTFINDNKNFSHPKRVDRFTGVPPGSDSGAFPFFFRDGCKMLNGRSSAPDWRFNIWQFWVKDWRVANIKKKQKTASHQQTILSAVSPKRYQAVQGSFSHSFFLVFAMKIELFIKEKELLWIGPRSNTLIESVGVSAKCIF